MITPVNEKLFAKCEKRAKTRFSNYPTFSAYKWAIERYVARGGIFSFGDDADKMAAEKAEALNTIEKALTDKGFKKVDDNSFIVGNSLLQFNTIANLLEISKSHMPWYEFLVSQSASITSDITIKKHQVFCIEEWGPKDALILVARSGVKPVRIPIVDAHALVKSSRKLSTRERYFK